MKLLQKELSKDLITLCSKNIEDSILSGKIAVFTKNEVFFKHGMSYLSKVEAKKFICGGRVALSFFYDYYWKPEIFHPIYY